MAERYSQSNAPLLFQLRRNLVNCKQDNLSVSDYFGKLEILWNDIQGINPILLCDCVAKKSCICGITTRILAADAKNKIIDFLMGLNDSFEGIHGQILGMDPLPPLNEAFYLVQQIEQQKLVTNAVSSVGYQDSSALAAGKQ